MLWWGGWGVGGEGEVLAMAGQAALSSEQP